MRVFATLAPLIKFIRELAVSFVAPGFVVAVQTADLVRAPLVVVGVVVLAAIARMAFKAALSVTALGTGMAEAVVKLLPALITTLRIVLVPQWATLSL